MAVLEGSVVCVGAVQCDGVPVDSVCIASRGTNGCLLVDRVLVSFGLDWIGL